MPVSFLRLEAKKHLETYNEASKHAISLQHFCLSSATKVICMRTASLSLPSAPYFAPVVNISLFITHDSLARLQEMVSVYRRAIPKRARMTPRHRRVGPRQRCSVCLSTPTPWVEKEPGPEATSWTGALRQDPNHLRFASPLLPCLTRSSFPFQLLRLGSGRSRQPHLTTCCTLRSSRVAKFLQSTV